MDRRSFIKIAGMSGLALAAPLGVRHALAEAQPYEGPYFVLINAGGGWDPIYLCDPKAQGPSNRLYAGPAQAGNLSYAPVPLDAAALGVDAAALPYLMSNQQFFEKYSSSLLVLNGVDMATNNHDAGTRATWSGQLAEGYPSFGALVAATRAPESALAYISAGGYDATEGLIPLTRMSSLDALKRIAYPNETSPGDPMTETYHSAATAERIRKAQAERLMAKQAGVRLPRAQGAMSELFLARGSDGLLRDLVLPDMPVSLPGYQLSDLQGLMQQAQLAVAAFKAKMAVAASLNIGGFDTHGNHDMDQIRQLAKLLMGVDFLIQEAENAGLGGQITVVIGSDFGRGPTYNGDNQYAGKDHWTVTSAMMLGKGIAGNRVVGATDEEQQALPIDPGSLASSPGGVTLRPETIHRALRKLAGIEAGEPVAEFPLAGDDMPKLLSG